MSGNEINVCKFLFLNKGHIELNHIGLVQDIAAPIKERDCYISIQSVDDLSKISTSDSRKKADAYINGQGVSIKQSGGNFSFNRLQRANLLSLFMERGLTQPEAIVTKLDRAVEKFHKGILLKRNQPWQDFFSEKDFRTLMNFLMLKGSPNLGLSDHPAKFILEASQTPKSDNDLALYSFDEYFEQYKLKFEVAIRRQWIGQQSESEHARALGISSKSQNEPWVFDNIVGQPRPNPTTQQRWRSDFPESDRRTVYFLMIEKKK